MDPKPEAKPVTFYDIASGPPVRPFAPNPWKVRYALNFTLTPYRTSWVELLDVEATRKELGLSACRTHADGSAFYTLPIIHDHAADKLIGDSFDIALHLDATHPHPQRRLFPPGTVALHRAFNAFVDGVFTPHIALVSLPFNPATAAQTQAEFCRRFGVQTWAELEIKPEARPGMLRLFEDALGQLAAYFTRRDEGPFLEGRDPTYADLIIGGWLQCLRNSLPEWEGVRAWHGGLWGRLYDALEEFAQVY